MQETALWIPRGAFCPLEGGGPRHIGTDTLAPVLHDQILSRIYISKLPKQLFKHASVTHLEAAEVLNAPDFNGAIR